MAVVFPRTPRVTRPPTAPGLLLTAATFLEIHVNPKESATEKAIRLVIAQWHVAGWQLILRGES